MIKYMVMDFSDVKEFQKFRIGKDDDDDIVYMKLPRFLEGITKQHRDCLKKLGRYDMPPEIDMFPVLRNAYKVVKDQGHVHVLQCEYIFIDDNTECIVKGEDLEVKI